MNNEKIILEIIDNDQQIVIKKFKSILNLSKAYPHIPYNNLRMIYLDNKKEVQFNFNDRIYTGCGKFLADNALNNKWVLEKIGNNIINVSEYNRFPIFEIDIEKNKLSGNDGCNSINGNIEVQGSRIKFGTITSTKMGCAKKSINNIISNLINNNIASYYFKDGKLYFYLIDDSLLVFKPTN